MELTLRYLFLIEHKENERNKSDADIFAQKVDPNNYLNNGKKNSSYYYILVEIIFRIRSYKDRGYIVINKNY